MKIKNTVFFTVICLFGFFALFGCSNALLVQPTFQTDSSGDANVNTNTNVSIWGAPQKVTVSHGQKKQVTLTWEAVRGAVRYTVYSSDSPFKDFKSVKESTLPEAVISEKSGVVKYYKVYAVDKSSKLSDASAVVTGSSLGVPQITNISLAPDMESSSSIIEWLVPNIGSGVSTYEDTVTYTIFYADASGTKKEAGKIDAKVGGAAQQFTVTGLDPVTDYYFSVQSALVSTPDVIEESLAVNKATVQKMKPDKPADLKAEQGINKTKIILTWICPGNVELPNKDELGKYKSTPLFFKIYRKKAGAAEFVFLEEHKASSETPFAEGAVITYEDNKVPEDAVYEYRVQSFADNDANPSTSNLARAETTGWRLRPILKFNRTIENDREQNESGINIVTGLTITFKADWSNYGNEAPYTVSLLEEKSIGDTSFPEGSQTAVTENLGFAGGVLINTATGAAVSFKKTVVPNVPEYYRYTLKISRDGATVLERIGSFVVVAEIAAPIAAFTSVTDGYVDNAMFEWKFQQGTRYKLQVRLLGSSEITDYPIEFEIDPNDEETVRYELKGLADNTDYEIAMQANNGVIAQSDYSAVTTLGIPQVTINSYDSKKVTLSWATVKGGHEGIDPLNRSEKVATYELTYQKLTTEASNELVSSKEVVDISALTQIDGKLEYVLYLPDAHALNGFASGNPFDITVTAKSGGEASKIVSAQLVGPAKAALSATQAISTDAVNVSWNEIPGAQSYYIDRTSVTDNETDRYYVSGASETWSVAVYNPTGTEAAPGITVVKNGTKLTLTDKVVPKSMVEITADGKPKNYSDRQATLRWGKQFEYSVVPWCGDDIEYNTIDKKAGYVFGYPKNIKATKAKHNDKVIISWEHPDVPANATKPQYKVFRKTETETGTDSWTELESSFMSGLTYTDDTIQNRVGYRYLVAASYDNKVSNPCTDNDFEGNFKKESFTEFNITDEPLNVGYKLAKPEFTPTREEITDSTGAYGIKLNWGVTISNKYNRGIKEYKISIQNNNIDSQWHEVKTAISANKQTYNEAFYTNSDIVKQKNLMKVLRDYKINFRITAIGDGEGVQTHGENWGARQITHEEFAKVATLTMALGIHGAVNNQNISWSGSQSGSTTASSPGSGNTSIKTYGGGVNTVRSDVTFKDYKPVIITKSGVKVTFSTIASSTMFGNTEYIYATYAPVTWRTTSDTMAVIGPSDISNMYSGNIKLDSGFRWDTTDKLVVTYNGSEKKLPTQNNSAIPFYGTGWIDDSEVWR